MIVIPVCPNNCQSLDVSGDASDDTEIPVKTLFTNEDLTPNRKARQIAEASKNRLQAPNDPRSRRSESISMSQISIDILVRSQCSFEIPIFVEESIRRILAEEGISTGTISIAIVDDAEIHRINREFLDHDYATDVISFVLNDPTSDFETTTEFVNESSPETDGNRLDHLEGELIVSSETAEREAPVHGWSPEAELLLYVIHGMLHLCGYDDLTDEARPVMRSRERELLSLWGFCPTGLEM